MGRNIYRLQISTFKEYTQHIKCLVKVSEGDNWISFKNYLFGRAYLEQASCQADEKLFY